MTLNLKLAYPTLPGDATERQTTAALIRHAVTSQYREGIPRLELRVWGKIEALLDGPDDTIDLSTSQWTFIRDAVNKATWPVPWTKMVLVFLDALEEAERAA